MIKDKKMVVQELEKKWYDAKEIEKIIEWLDDIDKKNLLTPEEVYRRLLAKNKVYV